MAERAKSVAENVSGDFFVDTTCIDCGECRQLAPHTFADANGYSFVQLQPRTPGDDRAALRALLACPTASIGCEQPARARAALGDFPLELAAGVYYCGFNSPKSYGGNSYFVRHDGGNWLIDPPRFNEPLARALERLGGVQHIFLTHRDDVADA